MEEKSESTSKPNNAAQKQWMTWVLAVLIVLLLLGVGYLWVQRQRDKDDLDQLKKDKQNLQQQLDKLKKTASTSSSSSGSSTCNDTPSTAMTDNIKAALDTKNTAVFATYVTDPVYYILAASEYGGDVSPDEAATSLEYTHSATGPWDFNLPAATVAAYDAGFYTDYFDANTYVGKAASGMVVSFDFNCDGKIKQIFVAADDDLL